MKITVLLLTLAVFGAQANGLSQTITLSGKGMKLKQVFASIKKQTGYVVFYNQDYLNGTRPVSFSVTNMPLTGFLDLILKDQPLSYQIKGTTIALSRREIEIQANPADEKKENASLPIDVRGRVVNEKGEPVEGVTVRVKGTDKQTATNANGEFSLATIENDATLVFTHVSMETFELKVSGKTELAISLKTKISALGDVQVTVNTGYEKIPKERATGAFGFINKEELNRKAGPDILSRLEGVTTGVLFDRRGLTGNQSSILAGNILIRGLNTLSDRYKTPLIIVDNFPYEGDINNINPNDVENVTILKDAAAASIWGARAGNGVIVIATKRGQYNQPFKLSLNTNIQIIQKPDLFANEYMSGSDFIDVEKFLFEKGFFDGDLFNPAFPALSPVIEILEQERNGTISAAAAAGQIDALRKQDIRNDFSKYVYRQGLNTQFALDLSGGSSKLRYSFSGGYDHGVSTLRGDDYQRITFRNNTSLTPLKNFEINLGIAFTNSLSKNNSTGNIGSTNYVYRDDGRVLYPYAQLADINGNPVASAKDYRSGYTDTAGAGKLLDWKYRVLDEIKNADNSLKQEEILFNLGANYKLTSFLGLQINYQYQSMNGVDRKLFSEETYYTRDLINLFSQVQPNSVTYVLPNGGILDLNNSRMTSHIARGQFNFNENWDGIHTLTGIAGGEIREIKNTVNSQRLYGFDPQTYTSVAVDYINMYPQYGDRGTAPIEDRSSALLLTDHFVSLYTNLAYSYKNRYILSASARRDAANVFGVNVNSRWKPFWTVGGAWNIHEEAFYKSRLVPYLKLRATFGYQGNVNNTTPRSTIIGYTFPNIANLPQAFIGAVGNPELSWETLGQLNLAVDFKVADRLSGSIDLYRKESDNLIWDQPIDITTGVGSVKKNSASMIGKGIEVLLSTVNIKGKFQWNTQVGYSFITNKVTNYDPLLDFNLPASGPASGSGFNIRGIRGKSPYSIFSYPFAGLDPVNGDPQGWLGKEISKNYRAIFEQLYDTANLVYHGSAIPTSFGFINNIFSYKGISILVNINYSFGYYFRKNTISYFDLIRRGIQHPDYAGRWKVPGDEATTTIPSFTYPVNNRRRDDFYAYSSANVYKGDHIRLKNIRISYDITRSVFKKLPFQSLQLYGNVENIGILWRANKEDLDPDYDRGNGLFPVPRTITFGLTMDF